MQPHERYASTNTSTYTHLYMDCSDCFVQQRTCCGGQRRCSLDLPFCQVSTLSLQAAGWGVRHVPHPAKGRGAGEEHRGDILASACRHGPGGWGPGSRRPTIAMAALRGLQPGSPTQCSSAAQLPIHPTPRTHTPSCMCEHQSAPVMMTPWCCGRPCRSSSVTVIHGGRLVRVAPHDRWAHERMCSLTFEAVAAVGAKASSEGAHAGLRVQLPLPMGQLLTMTLRILADVADEVDVAAQASMARLNHAGGRLRCTAWRILPSTAAVPGDKRRASTTLPDSPPVLLSLLRLTAPPHIPQALGPRRP